MSLPSHASEKCICVRVTVLEAHVQSEERYWHLQLSGVLFQGFRVCGQTLPWQAAEHINESFYSLSN